MAIKDHCGKYQELDVMQALDKTRLNETNRKAIIEYLCYGYRLKDLDISKQQAFSRIKKIILALTNEERNR